jgi:hypothetical protein
MEKYAMRILNTDITWRRRGLITSINKILLNAYNEDLIIETLKKMDNGEAIYMKFKHNNIKHNGTITKNIDRFNVKFIRSDNFDVESYENLTLDEIKNLLKGKQFCNYKTEPF